MFWIIDVCRYCHQKATWPFCEHRDNPGGNWTAPVRVRGTPPKKIPLCSHPKDTLIVIDTDEVQARLCGDCGMILPFEEDADASS